MIGFLRGVARLRTRRFGVVLAVGLISIHLCAFLLQPPGFLGSALQRLWNQPRSWLYHVVDAGFAWAGVSSPSMELRHGALLFLSLCVLPWLIMLLLGRGRPRDIGFRRPNRLAWRVITVGFAVSIPFLLWMVGSEHFGPYYRPHIARVGGWVFVGYYAANMFCEHFFFHGVMLAVLRIGFRWPAPPTLASSATSGVGRVLQWVGLAQPTGDARGFGRIVRWLGLRDGCVGAIVLSALLFGLIHAPKDPRELLLSFPGGAGMGYLAFRSNSLLTPFLLHVVTAGAACLLMLMGS